MAMFDLTRVIARLAIAGRRALGAHVAIPFTVFSALLVLCVGHAPAASAAEGVPQWTVNAVSLPTNFEPGDESGKDSFSVLVTNTGGAASNGSPIAITDELPDGLALDAVGATGSTLIGAALSQPSSTGFNCAFLTCTYTGVVRPDQSLVFTYPVDVAEHPSSSCEVPVGAVSCVTNAVRVSGGGAADASVETPTLVSEVPASAGISSGGATTALSSVQAGAHADLTTSIAFNTVNSQGSLAGAPKDTTDELPSGFAGDLVDTPVCSLAVFALHECPVATQIGVTTLVLNIEARGVTTFTDPVYNLPPDPGNVAKIGFDAGGSFNVQGNVALRPGDYGLTTTFENTYEVLTELDRVSLTIWGVPSDPIHDPTRWQKGEPLPLLGHFNVSSDAAPFPFLTNPTSCGSALKASFSTDFWEEPGREYGAQMPFGLIVGCDRLSIEPSLEAQPSTTSAYSTTGLSVNLKVPQTYENEFGLASSHVDDVTVVLPEGMTANPSLAAGLGACSEAEFKYEAQTAQPVVGLGCPSDSKIGTVKIVSPAIKEEASGSVFIAQPYANPFSEPGHPHGSLLALYVVARIPNRGVVVAVPGQVSLNQETGQLTTTFKENPQLPFSQLTFSFREGQASPLVTPPVCGTYTTGMDITSWSLPSQNHPLSSKFEILSGVGGGPCPAGGIPPFAPQVISGTESDASGSYSPFYLRIAREDGEQELTRFSTIMPPGLTGNLSGIPFCPEADIQLAKEKSGAQEQAEPSCPAASEIGHTIVEAGVGEVLAQTPGKIYLAGPYRGAPLSIVSVTSAKVGPFDLGTVVIRFGLNINPVSAQVEVSGERSDPIPHIIRGIVVHVRDIRVYVDREKFILNPTNCAAKEIAGAIGGAGANPANPADQDTVATHTHFQVTDCASLGFKPLFKASTSGKTSRTDGASLHVTLAYPGAPQGTQANIRSVKVDLPKQLPSRLTTLQKACPDSVFDANPADCPAASKVGSAQAITPILPVPLVGPAYFVSHGGAKFPELVVVLQGYGITIDLHGETFISKAGITSSTFRTVPDQPVTSFELTLPEGADSALAANGNFCSLEKTVVVKRKLSVGSGGHRKIVTRNVKSTVPASLVMPTIFTAQNGASVKQNTKIAVTGCPKSKVKAKPHGKAKR